MGATPTGARTGDGGTVPPPGLRVQARGALGWLGTRQIILNIVRIVSVSIVARTLGPAEFGIAALAVAASRFLLLFSEGGPGVYLIRFQERNIAELIAEARAVFWFNQAITAGQVGLLIACIPLARSVFDEGKIAGPLVVLGAAFMIRQMSVVPEALARREFAYRALVLRDLMSGILAAVLSVVLALNGAGVYSIVLPGLLVEPLRLVLLFRITRFRPGWRAGLNRWRDIYGFTKHLIGTQMLFLVLNDGDTLLIGGTLGPEAVGIYSLAWTLASLVGRNVVGVVTDVALPTFAKASQRGDLASIYRRSLQVLATITLPLQFLLAACAGAVVAALYGDSYADTAPVLSVLAVFMAVRGVTSLTGPVFNVLGTPKTGLLLGIATLPPYLAAIIVGAQWGVIQVALAVALVRIVGGVWGLILSIDKLQANRQVALGVIARAVPGALAGALAALLLQFGLPHGIHPLVQFGLAAPVGLMVATATQFGTNRQGVTEARRIMLGQ